MSTAHAWNLTRFSAVRRGVLVTRLPCLHRLVFDVACLLHTGGGLGRTGS